MLFCIICRSYVTKRTLTSDWRLTVMLLCVWFVCTEEDFLLSQAALLEQVSNMQPLLDSTYIRSKYHLAGICVFTWISAFLVQCCSVLVFCSCWINREETLHCVFTCPADISCVFLLFTDVPEHATKLQRLSQIHIKEQVTLIVLSFSTFTYTLVFH